jgi:hypothetical protein
MNRRERVLAVVDDAVIGMIFEDRREDDDLSPGDIEEAIAAGEVTVQDMVNAFEAALLSRLSPNEVAPTSLIANGDQEHE